MDNNASGVSKITKEREYKSISRDLFVLLSCYTMPKHDSIFCVYILESLASKIRFKKYATNSS